MRPSVSCPPASAGRASILLTGRRLSARPSVLPACADRLTDTACLSVCPSEKKKKDLSTDPRLGLCLSVRPSVLPVTVSVSLLTHRLPTRARTFCASTDRPTAGTLLRPSVSLSVCLRITNLRRTATPTCVLTGCLPGCLPVSQSVFLLGSCLPACRTTDRPFVRLQSACLPNCLRCLSVR